MNNSNPLKAIRAKCLDCCCMSANEVKLCTFESCALYPFRLGKNPYRKKKEYTEDELARKREQFKANMLKAKNL